MRASTLCVLAVTLGTWGCGDSDSSEPNPGGDLPDPFAPQADTSEGLTNVSADLEALLEHGALPGACEAWEADPGDRAKKLLCGKSMFFYEGFDTLGMPAALVDFLVEEVPDTVGVGLSGFGLIADPNSPQSRPLGFTPGAPFGESADSLALTCATCHFGRLPDGRYAVGAANLDYDYGGSILSIMLPAQHLNPAFDPTAHAPEALEIVAPVVERLTEDSALAGRLLDALLPLLDALTEGPSMSPEIEAFYASWKTGTMDFAIAPLPVEDNVHTISKIISLWDLATPEEQSAAQMPHGMLAWSGGAPSLADFLEGFVVIGGGDEGYWTRERLSPLEEYIFSLRAPTNPDPAPADQVARGEQLFRSEGCISCHDGPRGAGRRVFTYEEIGTDDAMKRWGDPNLEGSYCCGLGDPEDPGPATHGIKSPRLTGLWALKRFLHNGSVDSLESLLCLDGERGSITTPAYGDDGHRFGCELEESQRRDLVAWLKTL